MLLEKGQKVKIIEKPGAGEHRKTRYGIVEKLYRAFVLVKINGIRECFNYNDLKCKQVRIKILK